ncbi:MAG: LPS biosynthesis protein WbpP, partial [Gemmatimonadetes bacterium]|nr:LPS biosynthesis protein WbpP [Gemmatimonadota bacterium]
SVNTLWKEIREATGARVEAVHGPPRPGDVRDSLASLAKIREGLGYEVTVPLAEGLGSTVAHFRDCDG